MIKITINQAIFALGLGALSLSSCNSFLDTMPDKRMDLNKKETIRELLVSAYPNVHHMGMLEPRTDNYGDNGDQYIEYDFEREGYLWQDLTGIAHESSSWMWDFNYEAIGTANQALAAISQLPNPSEANAERAEALLVRAWCHFNLANYFAQAYSSATANSTLGIPYVTEPERKVGVLYPRLMLSEVYALIEKDIQEALPIVNDRIYKAGAEKYHFNSRAATAFAAQFYLYYEKWDKAKEYATLTLGNSPSRMLRNLKPYAVFNTGKEVTDAYNAVREPANLMLLNTISLYGRYYSSWRRYAHQTEIGQQTVQAEFPGGSLGDFNMLFRTYSAHPKALGFMYKYQEYFQITDMRNNIGTPRVIAMPFTADKTLLVRAEANNMLKLYDEVAADLTLYYKSKGGSSATAQEISDFYNVPQSVGILTPVERRKYETMLAGVCKPLAPHFGLELGMQYNLAQAVLHARRAETLFEGDRWFDIKRYRIAIKHQVHNGDLLELGADDLRKAMQIPPANVSAGILPNPR